MLGRNGMETSCRSNRAQQKALRTLKLFSIFFNLSVLYHNPTYIKFTSFWVAQIDWLTLFDQSLSDF